jgi:hypothetical protein
MLFGPNLRQAAPSRNRRNHRRDRALDVGERLLHFVRPIESIRVALIAKRYCLNRASAADIEYVNPSLADRERSQDETRDEVVSFPHAYQRLVLGKNRYAIDTRLSACLDSVQHRPSIDT